MVFLSFGVVKNSHLSRRYIKNQRVPIACSPISLYICECIEMNYPEANLWVLKAVSRQDPFIRSKLRGMDPRGIQFVQDVKDKFDTRV